MKDGSTKLKAEAMVLAGEETTKLLGPPRDSLSGFMMCASEVAQAMLELLALVEKRIVAMQDYEMTRDCALTMQWEAEAEKLVKRIKGD